MHTKERIIGLDLLRTFAILFVIGGHFFQRTDFRTADFEGISLFLQGMASFLFRGVPLFILLTGYLNSKKTISVKYYKKSIPILISYLFFSTITIFFRKYYLQESYSSLEWIQKIFDFSAIPYGWYINMWIGLFLLCPFLNILYHNIPSKKQKIILIAILVFLTNIPILFNRYGITLFPDFWKGIYPLSYYFIGLYIREYKPTISKFRGWLIILSIISISPIVNLLFIKNYDFIQFTGDTYGVFGLIISVTFFIMYYQWEGRNKLFNSFLTSISLLCLDMYLCLFIFDSIIYKYFLDRFFINQSQFVSYFFIIIPIIFVCTALTAWMKQKLFSLFRIH